MQNTILTTLVVTFICLFAAGLLVYTVFFAIHKIYFRRYINLIKKFNELINGLSGINIFKMQVLATNDIGEKLDLKKYIEIYKKIKNNSAIIKSNIATSELELNSFNLKIASEYIQLISIDLNKSLCDLKELQVAYVRYTQYGQAIESTFQNYLNIYETLSDFYNNKITFKNDFTKIINLFISTQKTFQSLPKLSTEFDYKKTIDAILDLGRKLRTLTKVVLSVYRFQVINSYLKTTKDYNEKLITKHYGEISTSDLQLLQNNLTIFNHAYSNFIRNYKALDLAKALDFSIQATDAINRINQFTYIHINTPVLINLSINEIREQTNKILANKNDIINSMSDLKQYFVLEPKIIDCFNTIEKNINCISSLSNSANSINYKTHSEKVNAVQNLDNIANQIIERKEEIVQSIDVINDLLSKTFKTVTDLNDLYIYFWQLLTYVKKMSPSDLETENLETIINKNLKQINDYLNEMVSSEKPDFDKIAYELSTIIEQSQQIYMQITTTVVLKTYVGRLFTYVNRYKPIKDLNKYFEKANKLLQDKKYSQCIDQLLIIAKQAKKYKSY